MRTTILAWLVATVLLPPVAANAAESIEEIIVTADFRGRTLAEVPVSVSVLDAAMVNDLAVQHFEELVNIVPNMNWSGDGHRARYFQIRGVGELEQYQGAPNPSIGFLIDDIDFSGIGTIATLFDLESVEVMRGPQGSRYGANALGGLVYVRSKEPTAAPDARVKVSAGSDDALSLGAAFGAALDADERAKFRLSAQKYTSNGFRDNPYLGRDDSNGRDELALRARLDLQASDVLTAKLAMLYSRIDNGYDAFALDNSYVVLSDNPGRDAQESTGASLRFDWDLNGALTATSISSFATSNIDFSFDADWGNSESWAPVTYDYVSLSDRQRDTLSQELRLGNERWLVGVYALQLKDDTDTLNRGDYYDPFYDFADSLDERFASEYEAVNVAFFAQYNWMLGAATTVSSGMRLEHRSTEYQDSAGMIAEPSETMWGGEIGISHALSENVNAHLSFSRGYKAGGFNLGPVPAGKRNFDNEIMWTVEAGLKAQLLEQRLQMAAALFHYRRDDQQVRSSTQLVPGDPASFVFFTDNSGQGDAIGAELEMRYFGGDAWEFYASAGLLEATMDNGRGQAHAPRYTLGTGVVYRHANGFFVRVDATAKDDFYFDVSHDQKSDSYELLNARIGVERDAWQASIWARNILDENYAVRGFYFGNEPPDFPNTLYTRLGDPRQLGITYERSF